MEFDAAVSRQEKKPLLSSSPSLSASLSPSEQQQQHTQHPRTSSLTSFFASSSASASSAVPPPPPPFRRSASQDYGSSASASASASSGLSRSVELPSVLKGMGFGQTHAKAQAQSPQGNDEFSDDQARERERERERLRGRDGSDKVGGRLSRTHANSGGGSAAGTGPLMPANALSGGKIIKSGRQRKKTAARSKGGEFQARRKKRRLYFCTISSEIDVEKLADHFLVEVKAEPSEEGIINEDKKLDPPKDVEPPHSPPHNKFPLIKGRMYDEVLYLYTDVSQVMLPHITPEHESNVVKNLNGKKVHYSQEEQNAEGSYLGAASTDVDETESATISPFHGSAAIGMRTSLHFPKSSGQGYSSAVSGNTSSESYSSDGGHSKPPRKQVPTDTRQGLIFTIDETSDVELTPVRSPIPIPNFRGRAYGTDDEDFDASPVPTGSLIADDHQGSDSEYYDLAHQTSDVEENLDSEKIRLLGTDRRGSIDKTEEGMNDFQSTAQFWHNGGKELFVFNFGAIVFWGYQRDEVKELMNEFRRFIVKGRLSEAEFEAGDDDMAFVTSEDAENIAIANDVIVLPDRTTVQMRLAVSFAIAQSSILSIFEARIEEKIEEYKYIPETLALSGKVKLSQKDLGNMIGEVFVIRHDVNLHSEILDIPDYFWKEQVVEPLYRLTMMYLEIEPRTEVVNKRLDLLRELLRLLQHQHENAHAVKLEWIVIWLIVVSVVLELMIIVGKLFNFDIES